MGRLQFLKAEMTIHTPCPWQVGDIPNLKSAIWIIILFSRGELVIILVGLDGSGKEME